MTVPSISSHGKAPEPSWEAELDQDVFRYANENHPLQATPRSYDSVGKQKSDLSLLPSTLRGLESEPDFLNHDANDATKTGLSSSLDDYDMVKEIGRGQFGTVHEVHQLESLPPGSRNRGPRKVIRKLAWKVVSYALMESHEVRQLQREVILCESLHHPNVVRYLGRLIDRKNSRLCLVMEHCGGGDLGRYLNLTVRKGNPLSEPQILIWCSQLIEALHYCHTRPEGKVLHRDIKPQNVLLDKAYSEVRLADFGLAKILKPQERLAITHVGTPYYMSPEVITRQYYDERSDVWSLGCVLYEMVCGRAPYGEAMHYDHLKHLVQTRDPRPLPIGPPYSKNGYSMELSALIMSMLQRDVSSRPDTTQLRNTMVMKYARGLKYRRACRNLLDQLRTQNRIIENLRQSLSRYENVIPMNSPGYSSYRSDYNGYSQGRQGLPVSREATEIDHRRPEDPEPHTYSISNGSQRDQLHSSMLHGTSNAENRENGDSRLAGLSSANSMAVGCTPNRRSLESMPNSHNSSGVRSPDPSPKPPANIKRYRSHENRGASHPDRPPNSHPSGPPPRSNPTTGKALEQQHPKRYSGPNSPHRPPSVKSTTSSNRANRQTTILLNTKKPLVITSPQSDGSGIYPSLNGSRKQIDPQGIHQGTWNSQMNRSSQNASPKTSVEDYESFRDQNWQKNQSVNNWDSAMHRTPAPNKFAYDYRHSDGEVNIMDYTPAGSDRRMTDSAYQEILSSTGWADPVPLSTPSRVPSSHSNHAQYHAMQSKNVGINDALYIGEPFLPSKRISLPRGGNHSRSVSSGRGTSENAGFHMKNGSRGSRKTTGSNASGQASSKQYHNYKDRTLHK